MYCFSEDVIPLNVFPDAVFCHSLCMQSTVCATLCLMLLFFQLYIMFQHKHTTVLTLVVLLNNNQCN